MKGFGNLTAKERICAGPESALWKPKPGKRRKKSWRELTGCKEAGREILTRGMIGELVDRILVFENRGIQIVYRFSGECRDWFAPAYPPGQQRKSAADSRLMEAEIREK